MDARDFLLCAEGARAMMIAEQDIEGLVAPDLIGGEIPFPNHVVGGSGGELETFLAGAQRVRGADAFAPGFSLTQGPPNGGEPAVAPPFYDINPPPRRGDFHP